MDTQTVALDTVRKLWPEHCEAVGDSQEDSKVEELYILQKDNPDDEAIVPSHQGGAAFSLKSAMLTLIAAMRLTDALIELARTLLTELSRKPAEGELVAAAKLRGFHEKYRRVSDKIEKVAAIIAALS